ncbi:hypothetical protein [Dactylosporangium sp. NPDC000521]|uniref:hypothetical protein n=1 Tax=Dactylosporangium sp. NPDC000521 TaxID=3363975 RepID=UPI0036A7924B
MSEIKIITHVRELDEARAVQLARSIIQAEASRLRLGVGNFSMSGRVKAKDQGVDGRTYFPTDSKTILPIGPQVWQVKSGKSVPSASKEIKPANIGLIEAIKNGHDYVLFWTNDPSDTSRKSVQDDFLSAVQGIRPDAKVTFIFGDEIQRLFNANRALLALIPEFPLGGLIDITTWRRSQGFHIDYQPDEEREKHTLAIRAHVQSELASESTLNLYGDTGVGKSRLVLEALSEPGISERALVAITPDVLNSSLITAIVSNPESSLILVLDDCGAADRAKIKSLVDLAEGRIRLITIGPRYSRMQSASDSRFLEVRPLEAGASKAIALSVGLSETNAEFVARYTEGYPKLAYVLADSIAHAAPGAHLLERMRTESVGGILSSMLNNNNDVELLGGLAMFDRLGFDGEYAIETQQACSVLGISEEQFRNVVDRETGRFVSTAGRFRQISPRLLAVWLAAHYIDGNPRALTVALQGLSETLRDRMLSQMKSFTGDRIVGRALELALGSSPFITGALADVDEGSARLIHVAAIVNPGSAMKAIETAFASHTADELVVLQGRARRGVVEALEVLLWSEETFERAATSLLELAIAENETWSNNATGVLKSLFQVYLGGTTVSYSQRIAWCRNALLRFPAAAKLIIEGLAEGLGWNEMRTQTDFALGNALLEWRPKTIGEEISARREAWGLLFETASKGSNLEDVAAALAKGLRTAAARGLTEDILSTLPQIAWPSKSRVLLAQAIEHLLEYDSPPEDIAIRFSDLHGKIVGTSIAEKIALVLNKDPWELYEDAATAEPSALLVEVVDAIADSAAEDAIAVARQAEDSNAQTATLVFDLVARKGTSEALLTILEAATPTLDGATLGTFAGMARANGAEWAVQRLRQWLSQPLARLIPRAAHMLSASPELATIVLDAVRSEAVSAADLGRFLYGAWARELPAAQLSEIASLLAAEGDAVQVEHALGIISQWLDAHEEQEVDPQVVQTARAILMGTSQFGGRERSRSALYRERILSRLGLSASDDVEIVVELLSNLESFPSDHDLRLLDNILVKDSPKAVQALMQLIVPGDGPAGLNAFWLDRANLLSRMATQAPAEVLSAIRNLDQSRWRELPAHVDFSGEPNDLIRLLVLESTDEVVGARAAFRFIYPENFWTGPESTYLQGRRAVVATWMSSSEGPRFIEWLSTIREEIDQRIQRALLQEAEEY